jgi:hypothetical protein
MATINIYNAMRNKITLATHSAVMTQSGDADFSTQRTRFLTNATVTLVPGPNAVDTVFWANWQASNPASSLSRVIYPA